MPLSSFPFTKMQAVGNDFVVMDAAAWPEDENWPARAVALCDRRTGVGGDGLLVVSPSSIADARMRMFNPDGTEDMCGNGLRCVVRFAGERGRLGAGSTVETLSGVRRVAAHADGSITAEMGFPRFALSEIPVDINAFPERRREKITNLGIFVSRHGGSIIVDAVNTGSTHAVVWRDTLPPDDLFQHWSPLIETDRAFPERTSVLWAVVEPPETIRLRIWERGVGETLGCGTGACAAAVLAKAQDKLRGVGTVQVISPGGSLQVDWNADSSDPIQLTGPAEFVYDGQIYAP